MTHFRSLELAIDQATRQRDARALAKAQALRNLEFGKNQMAQLEGYAGETDARWVAGNLQHLSAEMVHHHYQFRERLQNAVNLQVGVIAGLQAQVEHTHQQLLQAEYRLAGLRQVLDARRAELLRRQARIEQRNTDEFAAQRYARLAAEKSYGESL